MVGPAFWMESWRQTHNLFAWIWSPIIFVAVTQHLSEAVPHRALCSPRRWKGKTQVSIKQHTESSPGWVCTAPEMEFKLTFYWMDSMNCTLPQHIWLWYENKLILTTAWGMWIKFLLRFYGWVFFSFYPSTVITSFSGVSKDIFRNCTNRMYVIYWHNSSINPSISSDSKLNGPSPGLGYIRLGWLWIIYFRHDRLTGTCFACEKWNLTGHRAPWCLRFSM